MHLLEQAAIFCAGTDAPAHVGGAAPGDGRACQQGLHTLRFDRWGVLTKDVM